MIRLRTVATVVAAIALAPARSGGEGCQEQIDCVPDGCPGGGLCSLRINEIRVSDESPVKDYVEIAGAPGTSLAGISYVVIGDGPGGGVGGDNSGVIETVIDLGGQTIPEDGYLLVAHQDAGFVADLPVELSFEDDDNLTHLLVEGLAGLVGDDLDTNDDGTLDAQPWSAVRHVVVLIKAYDAASTGNDHYYPLVGLNGHPLLVGPDYIAETSPSHFYAAHRAQPDQGGQTGPPGCNWGASLGPTDYAPLVDTPGAENVVARYEWCRWDVNMDGTTGIEDYWLVAAAIDGPSCGRREDVNADGVIDQEDLAELVANFGTCLPGDYNGDGEVDSEDCEYLQSHWSSDGGCRVGCLGDWDGNGDYEESDSEELVCEL